MYRIRFCIPSTSAARGLATEVPARKTASRIKLPNAIQRSPTAVLEALAGTVGVDKTAPHFAFIDDPLTIPSTAQAKKTYYMAKEMGKRAARQLAEEWPTLFAFDRDYPTMQAFRPQKAPDPLQVEPTEENLRLMMSERKVRDAVMLYERLRADNVDVSDDTQLELFRLVAYYNSRDPPLAEEAIWHGLRVYGLSPKQQWEPAAAADLLYETIEKTDEVKSTLIVALCKYDTPESSQRAKDILKEMLNDKQVPHVEAWNGLIAISPWKSAQELVGQMSRLNVKPDAKTFEALLQALQKGTDPKARRDLIPRVVAEAQAAGVSLSLAAYDLALQSIVPPEQVDQKISVEKEQKRLAVAAGWLEEILANLEAAAKIELHSAADPTFFITAMELASRSHNLTLARRLVTIYESRKNGVELPGFMDEDRFYRRYLELVVKRVEDIAEVEKTYKELVPRLVGVTRFLSAALLNRLKKSPHWPLTLRVIEDGICARFLADLRRSAEIREHLLSIPLMSLSVKEREDYTTLVKRMVNVWMELSNFTNEKHRRHQVKWSPLSVAESALLLLRVGETERAWSLLELLLDEDKKFGEHATVTATGFVRPDVLNALFDESLREKNAEHAAICLELMSDQLTRSKLEPLVRRIEDQCGLSFEQKTIIEGFVRLRPQ